MMFYNENRYVCSLSSGNNMIENQVNHWVLLFWINYSGPDWTIVLCMSMLQTILVCLILYNSYSTPFGRMDWMVMLPSSLHSFGFVVSFKDLCLAWVGEPQSNLIEGCACRRGRGSFECFLPDSVVRAESIYHSCWRRIRLSWPYAMSRWSAVLMQTTCMRISEKRVLLLLAVCCCPCDNCSDTLWGW